jgi:hypothetical protein
MNKECSAKIADLKRELKELREGLKESQRLANVGRWSWTQRAIHSHGQRSFTAYSAET